MPMGLADRRFSIHVSNVPVPVGPLLVRAASSAETKTAARFSEAAALLSADCIGQMGQMGQMYLSLLDVVHVPNVPVPLRGWETAVGAYASALAVMVKVVLAGMLLELPQKAPLLSA